MWGNEDRNSMKMAVGCGRTESEKPIDQIRRFSPIRRGSLAADLGFGVSAPCPKVLQCCGSLRKAK